MKTIFNVIIIISLAQCAATEGLSQQSYIPGNQRLVTTEGNAEVIAAIDIIRTQVIISDEFCAGPKQNIHTLTEILEANLKAVNMKMSDARLLKEETNDLGYTNANNSTVMIKRTYEITFGAARHYTTFKSMMPNAGMSLTIVEMKSSQLEKVKNEGLKLAYEDAKKTAEVLLSAAGGTLGQFIELQQREPWNSMSDLEGYSDYMDGSMTDEERLMQRGFKIEIMVSATFEVK